MKVKMITADSVSIEAEVNKWLEANKDKITFVFATQSVNTRSVVPQVMVMIYHTVKK